MVRAIAASLMAVAFMASGCTSGGDTLDAGSIDAGPADSGATSSDPQGLYLGQTTDGGEKVALLVVQGGQYWEWHYTSAGIYGGAVGTGALASGHFTTTQASISTAPAQLSASLSGGALDGTLTFGSGAASPSLAFSSQSAASYASAATIASIVGSWSTPVILDSEGYGQQTQTFTVESTGNVTASNPLGCTGAGTLTPSATGRGYFDLTLTYQGGTCIFGTQTLTGVALLAGGSADGQGELLTSIVTSDGSDGVVSSGLHP